MDILAHGVWAIILIKFIKDQFKIKAKLWQAFFFGIFPDIIAFTFLTIWSFFNFGLIHPEKHGAEMIGTLGPTLSTISEVLYSFSHSLVVIGIIILVIFIVLKKIPIVLLAWPLHILLDIPTHTSAFYPTPFLWPVSEITFSGIQWSNPLFMKINYAMMIFAICFLYRNDLIKCFKNINKK
ncbi:hypothetical protein HOA92_00690 [archaeon]|jgi:hypothetical protein|nr:hypothetical protein [archaeon]MBT6761534.1 hypothetical protein [archaeon]